MLNIIDLIQEGQLFHKEYASQSEYFSDISDYLLNLGLVTSDFREALETREFKYPTGLLTKSRIIALPHVDSKYVKKNAVFITCFKTPIDFRRMDDVNSIVPVTISFLLLIEDINLHMKAVQQLATIFQSDVLDQIYNAKDNNQVIKLIGSKFYESND